jgi:hypothetical protein
MSNTPKVPSGWQLERAVSAWEQLRELYASDPALADDEQVIRTALADAGVTHPAVLLDRVIDACAWAVTRAEEADAMRASFRDRRDRYRKRHDVLKQLAFDLLVVLGEQSRSARLGRAALRESPPGVVITDEEALEDRFVRIIREPQKSEIKKALKDGEVVEGAVLSNPATTVVVTRFARARTGADLNEEGE